MSLDPFSENQIWLGKSVRSRFLVSILSNTFRGGLSLATVFIVARGLGPGNYGNFVFLIGSFAAIHKILDLGASSAFFTFISQRPRGQNFINYYRLWQLAQFLVPFIIIGLLLPDAWISLIWVGEDRILILLAFAAFFLKDNAWNTVIQFGESQRLTQKVQVLWLCLISIHFLLVLVFWLEGVLSLTWLFGLIIVEYVIGLFLAEIILGMRNLEKIPIEFKSMFREYLIYCIPLGAFYLAGFLKQFADIWLIQNFGGSIEQGLYGIANQIALALGLFTISIHNVFLKEIAEAKEELAFRRVRDLYNKVSRLVFAASAILSGFLIPWSREIIEVLLGVSYLGGAGTLAVMLLSPVYNSLGQITGALYMATQKTKARAFFGIIFMVIHIPISYFILASGDAWLPGLEMGSLGLALKLVILQIINANVLVWWISKNYGWEYSWNFQVVVLSFVLGVGWVCHEMVVVISSVLPMVLLVKFGLALIVYFSIVGLAIWKRPDLTGMTQEEIRYFMGQVMRSFKVKV